ncbi:NADH-quinone oxidoreductase subunit A [Chloroflexota bacterium]
MLADYGYIGLLLIAAIAVPAVMLLLSIPLRYFKIRPSNPGDVKGQPYESGMVPVGNAWVQFNFRYYMYALLFVVFDIETVFLYPWAVSFKQLKLFGFVEMVIFILILVVGLVYAWRKKALEWK